MSKRNSWMWLFVMLGAVGLFAPSMLVASTGQSGGGLTTVDVFNLEACVKNQK